MIERHLRRPEVLALVGLKTSALYALMRKGKFPRPIKLTGHAVAWPESAVAAWLAERPTSTGAK